MKKKSSAIFLFLILTISYTGSYSWFFLQKQFLKREAKRIIERTIGEDQFIKLSFTKKKIRNMLTWENEHEFEFQGNMYDVVKTNTYADSVVYICWLDKKETKLNSKLVYLLNSKLISNSTSTKNQIQVFSIFKILYFDQKFENQNFDLVIKNKYQQFKQKIISYIFLEKPLPPPRFQA